MWSCQNNSVQISFKIHLKELTAVSSCYMARVLSVLHTVWPVSAGEHFLIMSFLCTGLILTHPVETIVLSFSWNHRIYLSSGRVAIEAMERYASRVNSFSSRRILSSQVSSNVFQVVSITSKSTILDYKNFSKCDFSIQIFFQRACCPRRKKQLFHAVIPH